MHRVIFSESEWRTDQERRAKYLGTAKVKINQILLPLEYDQDKVQGLRDLFYRQDCDRLSPRNHVVAVVSKEKLLATCYNSHMNIEALINNRSDSYHQLDFPIGQLECLQGQHRLRAGKEYLAPSDQWWTVNLYADDISDELRTELAEEYSNENAPSDGEIYRKIRQYQYEASARFEKRWWDRLSPTKMKRLRQLSQPEHAYIRSAFDALLPIPGLWKGLRIGNLSRVLALKCEEEIVHYLHFVKNFWSSLVHDDETQMNKIDSMTVERLQLLAPGISPGDRKVVQGLVLSGQVFDPYGIFFKDMSYLEACANCMKRLVVLPKPGFTIYSAMKASYQGEDDNVSYVIQDSETSFRRCLGTVHDRRDFGYRQLWLFAMRHYPMMPKASESNDLLAAARYEDADERIIHNMAKLATRLGFASPLIDQILQQSPDRHLARAALLKAREPSCYRYETLEALVTRITKCFDEAVPVNSQPERHHFAPRTVPLRTRCGKPRLEDHEEEQSFLFLDQIHTEIAADNVVSAFYVRQCVYFAFFGKTPVSPHVGGDEITPPSSLFVPDSSQDRGIIQCRSSILSDSVRSSHAREDAEQIKQRQLNQERRVRRRQRKQERRQSEWHWNRDGPSRVPTWEMNDTESFQERPLPSCNPRSGRTSALGPVDEALGLNDVDSESIRFDSSVTEGRE
ncbi:hypothetical protein BGW36DRAFT_401698 [Talaromyces proteolyticus]|uniref:Uncharacterized protein n=1 Tax=Talaromyces proteolyticus TaxID=1131652 RepID=A0AAD4KGZ6_9EURO|nr:uncharacterized protein BGW36DRAFT_401698 [Talaromyces proteolyticus]KAH8689289.1 hypothetical protein BGW36DRAFT_401698 [Talaromyces proteolyticus]